MSTPHRAIPGRQPLRLFVAEDREEDLLLLLHELGRGGYNVCHARAETIAALRSALAAEDWQLVVSDFSLTTAHEGPKCASLYAC